MKPVGGYFELETGPINSDNPFAQMPALNSGRHALEYILRQIDPVPSKVYLPYYTCEVVLEPLKRLSIPYEFYHIIPALEDVMT